MKSENKILTAFILNALFSVFEFLGGFYTGSISIISDAMHDFGDAISIGISYILEKISKRKPDNTYTFGYARYSVVGAIFTSITLILGSVAIIYNAIDRIINPKEIHTKYMLVFAIFGVFINSLAVFFTHNGHSHNEKAINLHMLEDVFGWIIVFIGSVIISITNITVIDPILSVFVSILISINAIKIFKDSFDIILEKSPKNIDVNLIEDEINQIDGVKSIYNIKIWSLNEETHYAIVHIKSDETKNRNYKKEIKLKFLQYGIKNVTIEEE